MSHTIPKKAAPLALAPVPPEQDSLKAFSTASAMALMWQKSSQQLSTQELQWFASGAAEQIGGQTRTLAAVLEGTACLVASDEEAGSFQGAGGVSTVLFNLQHQLDAITGLADIAADAGHRVRLALEGSAGHD